MELDRNDPRTMPTGLAAIIPAHGEVVFYAARHGTVAEDGPGINSPFTKALVEFMQVEGLELGRFFRKVTSRVLEKTKNRQEPFLYGRIPDEDYYFKPPRR